MPQSLNDIVQVTVEVSPASAVASTFNVGLIVGPSTVIPTATRTVAYSGTSDMTQNGWTGTEPEYKAAEIYFAQSPRPGSVVIGRQDMTITPAETPLEAVTASRGSNTDWYGVYVCGAAETDIEAVAQYIESVTQASTYFYDTSDAAITAGTTPNVMSTLQGDKYQRSIGIFSTTEYGGAALLGLAMGLNTGLANSAFTLDYKTLVSVTPEVLTTAEYNNITGYNGNVYTQFGASYDLFTKGTMADGTPFDQVLNLDVITAEIQTAAINALTNSPKIPQTSSGVQTLVTAITAPCKDARTRGIVAPGTWTAAPVLTLKTGATLPTGYLILADSIANQSQADRTARKSPPIYVCLKMAGAIQNVVIGVIVNQ